MVKSCVLSFVEGGLGGAIDGGSATVYRTLDCGNGRGGSVNELLTGEDGCDGYNRCDGEAATKSLPTLTLSLVHLQLPLALLDGLDSLEGLESLEGPEGMRLRRRAWL